MPSGIRRRRAAKTQENNSIRRRAKKEKKQKLAYGNPIVAANWDPKLTVAQNYRKLGLAVNMQKATGGVEDKSNKSEIHTTSKKVKTARIVRGADGASRVEYDSANEDDIDAPVRKAEAKTDVVRQLEELANSGTSNERHQSPEEQSWLSRLIERHGDDYRAMQWDKKLNSFQHSAGELKRRVKKFRAAQSKAAAASNDGSNVGIGKEDSE